MRELKIDGIAKLAAHAEKLYTSQTLTTVVMTLQSVPGETIVQTLGCSRISIWGYVDRLDRQGTEAAADHRGGSLS